MNTLFIQQQGAGNGKTYNLIKRLDDPIFHDFTEFIFIAKQHSVKYILYQEILKQAGLLTNIQINTDKISEGRRYEIPVMIKNQKCNICIRTVDSLTYSLSSNVVNNRDMFTGIALSIGAGHYEKDFIGAKTCIFCDETQDMPEVYGECFLRILRDTKCTLYVVGDLLQSIYFEKNTFSFLRECDFANKIIQEPINICRRFGGPALVNFVNKTINFKKYGLPEISPSDGKGTYNILGGGLQNIMKTYIKEAENRQPEDFLIISPFVKKNDLVMALENEIQRYWSARYKDGPFKNYVFLHVSEEYGSIDLSESEKATRIVSIHTSKGDGRPIVFVVNLDEKALRHFDNNFGLKYESLLHVALTRMKEKLYFFATNTKDDIWRRLQGTQNLMYLAFNINRMHLLAELKDVVFPMLNLPKLDLSNQIKHRDMSYHNLRYQMIMGNLYIKLGFHQKRFLTIQGSGVRLMQKWINRAYTDIVPIYNLHGTPFVKIRNYMNIVIQKLLTYKDVLPCALESIFINYAVDKTASYLMLTRAFNVFSKFDKKHHANCPCSQFFKENPRTGDMHDFLEEIGHINSKCDEFVENHPEIEWTIISNINVNIWFRNISLPARVAGKYGDELYMIICKTYLSPINYNDLLLDILIYEYALINHKVKTIVFALNLPEPLIISFTDFINDNAFFIDAVFKKKLLNDFEKNMIYNNFKSDGLKSLIRFNIKNTDVKEFLQKCKENRKIDLDGYSSIGERKCAKILADLFPNHVFIKRRPPWLEGLELDLYCEELSLAVEFNGLQHYRFTPYFHKTEDDFIKQVERDKRKADICDKRGVRLIVVKSLMDVESLLRNKKNELKL